MLFLIPPRLRGRHNVTPPPGNGFCTRKPGSTWKMARTLPFIKVTAPSVPLSPALIVIVQTEKRAARDTVSLTAFITLCGSKVPGCHSDLEGHYHYLTNHYLTTSSHLYSLGFYHPCCACERWPAGETPSGPFMGGSSLLCSNVHLVGLQCVFLGSTQPSHVCRPLCPLDATGDMSQVSPPLWIRDSAGRTQWGPQTSQRGVLGRGQPLHTRRPGSEEGTGAFLPGVSDPQVSERAPPRRGSVLPTLFPREASRSPTVAGCVLASLPAAGNKKPITPQNESRQRLPKSTKVHGCGH